MFIKLVTIKYKTMASNQEEHNVTDAVCPMLQSCLLFYNYDL